MLFINEVQIQAKQYWNKEYDGSYYNTAQKENPYFGIKYC